jgi:ABC-type transport system involved in multi-copper enzyme maturation permease subunit
MALPQSAHVSPARMAPTATTPIATRPNPLLSVLHWEVQRILASRTIWILAAFLFGVCLLLVGFSGPAEYHASTTASPAQTPGGIPVQHAANGSLAWTSLWGLAIFLPNILLEFGSLVPFVTADGVSLDVKRRTHEILMTTALPSWAFVWGRYLAGMLVAFCMACVLLLAVLVLGPTLHLVRPDLYPAFNPPGAVAIWAAVVLSTTLLLGSLSFALGVVLPRHTSLFKASIVLAWVAGSLVLPAYLYHQVRYGTDFARGNPPAWWIAYSSFDPTGSSAGNLFLRQFFHDLYGILDNGRLSNLAVQYQVRLLEGQMPNLASFVAAHVVLVVAGAAIVGVASLSFRRFRNVLA